MAEKRTRGKYTRKQLKVILGVTPDSKSKRAAKLENELVKMCGDALSMGEKQWLEERLQSKTFIPSLG